MKRVAVGIVIGLVIASLVFIVQSRIPQTDPVPESEAVHANHAALPPPEPSDAAVQLTADEQRQAGIQTTTVERRNVTDQLPAVGRVEEAETAIRTISARIGGRIDRLLVNFTGQPVQNGQPVAEIYSPEIVTAAEEYKLALENRQHLAASQQAVALQQADALIAASRRRLELWGLTPEQIETLITAPETPIHLTIASSANGIIRTRRVTEGQYVNAGDALFDVIDLSTVWVEADVFHTDIARIRPGLRAEISSDALPGTLRGTVSFIEPRSDPESRTTPVRIEVNNPGMRLRPGMFVNARFNIPLGSNVLTVPRTAVIDTGTEKLVYVALPDGVFQQRVIQTGTPAANDYPVVSGLAAGDEVVTHGVFLIDSQTRLTGGMTGLFGGSASFTRDAATAQPPAAHRITFRIEPDPPRGAQQSTVHVTIQTPDGNPVADAQVRTTIVMPAMPAMSMPEMRNSVDLQWNGSEYTGRIVVATAGSWNVVVEARRGNGVLATHRTRFDAR